MAKAEALTLEDMMAAGCDNPGCDNPDHKQLTLHAECHMDSPTWVTFDKTDGTLRVTCAECGDFIARIAVAASATPH